MSGAGHGATSQDFELNLASIIDCFTVLIAFMLASASFIAVGIIDAGVSAAGTTSTGAEAPAVMVSMELRADHSIELKFSGQLTRQEILAPVGGKWDHDGLTARLKDVATRFPTVKSATLSAENTVAYQDVVQSMEVTRKSLPFVLLGGF